MALPREIRDEILKYVLPTPEKVNVSLQLITHLARVSRLCVVALSAPSLPPQVVMEERPAAALRSSHPLRQQAAVYRGYRYPLQT